MSEHGALITPAGRVDWFAEPAPGGGWIATAVGAGGEVLGSARSGTSPEDARTRLAEHVLARVLAPAESYAAAGLPLPPRLRNRPAEIREPVRMAVEILSAAYVRAATNDDGATAGALPAATVRAFADALEALERLRAVAEKPLNLAS